VIVGTGALAELEPGHEELKSRRTDPAWRGRGVARWLRGFMLADACGRSVRRVSLETGSADFFAPARAVRLGRLRDLRSLRLLRRGCAGACAAVFVVPTLTGGFGWGNWFRGP
jgi:GNAT superfamily N-acetyltransferase